MRRISRRITAVVAAVVSLALLAGFLPVTRAYASTAQHDIMIGLAVANAYVSQGWHSPGQSIDLQNAGGSTAGVSVYSQTKWISGDAMVAYKASYISDCTGIKAEYKTGGGATLGRTAYVHINVSGSIPSSWNMAASGWTVEYLGSVINPEPNAPGQGGNDNCAWTGPHEHQSEEVATGSVNSGLSAGNSYATGSTWLVHLSD